MPKPTYIALDTETGGLTPDTSILTAYFAVLDETLNLMHALSLTLKPNDGNYVVNAQALTVNKINLINHDKLAITYSQAGQVLREFLIAHSNGGKTKLIPVGHNVYFDLEKIYGNLLGKAESQKYISYRLLDTGILAQALKAVGKMPNAVTGSLGSLVKHYGVLPTGELHTAEGDTLTTVEVLRSILRDMA